MTKNKGYFAVLAAAYLMLGLTIPLLGITMNDLVIRFGLPLDRGGFPGFF